MPYGKLAVSHSVAACSNAKATYTHTKPTPNCHLWYILFFFSDLMSMILNGTFECSCEMRALCVYIFLLAQFAFEMRSYKLDRRQDIFVSNSQKKKKILKCCSILIITNVTAKNDLSHTLKRIRCFFRMKHFIDSVETTPLSFLAADSYFCAEAINLRPTHRTHIQIRIYIWWSRVSAQRRHRKTREKSKQLSGHHSLVIHRSDLSVIFFSPADRDRAAMEDSRASGRRHQSLWIFAHLFETVWQRVIPIRRLPFNIFLFRSTDGIYSHHDIFLQIL